MMKTLSTKRILLIVAIAIVGVVNAGDINHVNSCQSNEIQCKDKSFCIPEDFYCDGVEDCDDGSDENLSECLNYVCPNNKFKCGDNVCIHEKLQCDGWQDCVDGSDEQFCDDISTEHLP